MSENANKLTTIELIPNPEVPTAWKKAALGTNGGGVTTTVQAAVGRIFWLCVALWPMPSFKAVGVKVGVVVLEFVSVAIGVLVGTVLVNDGV